MNNALLGDYLFCCLSPEQKKAVDSAGSKITPDMVYRFQRNLTMGKTAVTCNLCGKQYPVLQICDKIRSYLPETVNKLKIKAKKYKKRALLFLGNHYYAINRNNLQRYEVTNEPPAALKFEVTIPKEIYALATDNNERYFACCNYSGTITVADVAENRIIARKRQIGHAENFLFSPSGNNRILYFADNRIISWDFIENKDEVIWTSPDDLSLICRNVIYNRSRESVVFYCLGKTESDGNRAFHIPFAITIKGNAFADWKKLEGRDCLGRLVYSEVLQRYSLVLDDMIRIYDDKFEVIEEIDFPYFIQYSDGGGMFPITRNDKSSSKPYHVYLSPNGSLVLLDYFFAAILMDYSTKEVKYCLYNYKSSPYTAMGFIDDNHIWYANGDSTYIQDISEI